MLIDCYIKYVSGKINDSRQFTSSKYRKFDTGGIRTHATEVTGALNQRLRPLGHAILRCRFVD